MMDFYEEPEAMHELVDYITDWELAYAAEICKISETGRHLPS